jgi:hypothetical protein
VKAGVRERDLCDVLAHARHGRPFHVEGLHPVVGEVGARLGDAIAVEVVGPASGRALFLLQRHLEERVGVRSHPVQKRWWNAVVVDLEEAPVAARRGQLLLAASGVEIDGGQGMRGGRECVVRGQWLLDRLPLDELLQRARLQESRVLNDALGRESHGDSGNRATKFGEELGSVSLC